MLRWQFWRLVSFLHVSADFCGFLAFGRWPASSQVNRALVRCAAAEQLPSRSFAACSGQFVQGKEGHVAMPSIYTNKFSPFWGVLQPPAQPSPFVAFQADKKEADSKAKEQFQLTRLKFLRRTIFHSPNSVDTRGVLTVMVKHRCLIEALRGWSGYFVALYSTFMPLEILEVHFDCAGSQSLLGRGGCLSRVTPLSLWRRAHFRNLVLWWSKVDFS